MTVGCNGKPRFRLRASTSLDRGWLRKWLQGHSHPHFKSWCGGLIYEAFDASDESYQLPERAREGLCQVGVQAIQVQMALPLQCDDDDDDDDDAGGDDEDDDNDGCCCCVLICALDGAVVLCLLAVGSLLWVLASKPGTQAGGKELRVVRARLLVRN